MPVRKRVKGRGWRPEGARLGGGRPPPGHSARVGASTREQGEVGPRSDTLGKPSGARLRVQRLVNGKTNHGVACAWARVQCGRGRGRGWKQHHARSKCLSPHRWRSGGIIICYHRVCKGGRALAARPCGLELGPTRHRATMTCVPPGSGGALGPRRERAMAQRQGNRGKCTTWWHRAGVRGLNRGARHERRRAGSSNQRVPE